ncbi:PLP-dependent aminotransferase family protein [Aestuariicella hydrocarbonica]|uniref:PLP-dependent aminotransferase family protein n=1 Tax=Pseudomaricurvus hydrocarbonicus TaxID=1470433 RepID=A0A9E5MP02_9GAMM|nr:PLP-dependent aminotransferase family protein [Aestuariicella hydrocarbonica]NHO67662.1 PLP-dependent aminotransferase family protein [Aestuariicella hydrocarbonica]
MTYQITKPRGIIDLGVGQPDPQLLPAALFQSSGVQRQDLAYGEEAGDRRFRTLLAEFLSQDTGLTQSLSTHAALQQGIEAEQLLITTGSSNALDLICSRYARPGDTVLVEDPTYFIALNQFAEHGLKVVAVPMDEHGLCVAALELALQQHRPAFIYTVPSYHNPTGITQPESRRQALVALAKRYQCLLVADEVYQCLYFDAAPPPPLACFDPEAPVLSIGSFSKILAPGLRLGWIQASSEVLPRLLQSALLKSGGGLAPVTSALVASLMARGEFQRFLTDLRRTLRARRDRLHHSLQARLGAQLDINCPDGGYFLWATLRDGGDASESLSAARREGVSFLAGQRFSVNDRFTASMRLCFAWYDEDELDEACVRLARALG